MKIKNIVSVIVLAFCFMGCSTRRPSAEETLQSARWTEAAATEWYGHHQWVTGCNYTVSSAVNQLEMWQSDSFNPTQIDKELGWAQELGFNSMRVFLHSLVWMNDAEGFKQRIDEYLRIAWKHGISTTFVFFDDCWNPEAVYGKQPAPKTGIHNSGWVQDPIVSMRKDTTALYAVMEKYVKDIVTTFKDDERILMWDLYNEPGNSGHYYESLPLLQKIFVWARDVNPSQPLTAGVWRLDLKELNRFQVQNSDVLTYHCYHDPTRHSDWIGWLKLYNRPLICTEWMARRFNSTFGSVMPMLKEEHVGAYNWGFVAGKTNTIYAWDDPCPDGAEPQLWFHDIIRTDGTPFDAREIEVIKRLTH